MSSTHVQIISVHEAQELIPSLNLLAPDYVLQTSPRTVKLGEFLGCPIVTPAMEHTFYWRDTNDIGQAIVATIMGRPLVVQTSGRVPEEINA